MTLNACSGDRGSKANSPGAGGSGGSGPDQVASRFAPGDCNLDKPAFCENFETPEPGGRGGDLDDRELSYARFGSAATQFFTRPYASSIEPDDHVKNTPTFCGQQFTNVTAPKDVAVCDGVDGGGFLSKQFSEVFADFGGFATNSLRVRQPFDFTDRTGTVVFDVDAKKNDGYAGHGWWNEFWITEDPAPIPYHGAPTIGSYPRRGIGFQIISTANDCFNDGMNQVGRIVITEDYRVLRDKPFPSKCFKASDGKLNRFKVLISTDRVEFFVSDYDQPNKLVSRGAISGLNLKFSRGYVHFQHSQYNAPKDGGSDAQTYRWDNIAFDGPAYPVPRGYDVPDELLPLKADGKVIGATLGYYLGVSGSPPTPHTFKLANVDLTDALRATFNFDYHAAGGRKIKYRFNGNDWHEFEVPTDIGQGGTDAAGGESAYLLRAFSVEVPLTELVSGENTLEVALATPAEFHDVIGNLDLTIDPAK